MHHKVRNPAFKRKDFRAYKSACKPDGLPPEGATPDHDRSHIELRPEINFPRFGIIRQKLRCAFDKNLTFVDDIAAID